MKNKFIFLVSLLFLSGACLSHEEESPPGGYLIFEIRSAFGISYDFFVQMGVGKKYISLEKYTQKDAFSERKVVEKTHFELSNNHYKKILNLQNNARNISDFSPKEGFDGEVWIFESDVEFYLKYAIWEPKLQSNCCQSLIDLGEYLIELSETNK